MGHVDVCHRWDRVAMDLLDMSVTTPKGNRYVLVMVDCFSQWTAACPLPDKTALAVAYAFLQHVVCRFGMPSVIHTDQSDPITSPYALWVRDALEVTYDQVRRHSGHSESCVTVVCGG